MKKVKGYKVFNPDWTCGNKQYTCPGEFEEDLNPLACVRGMHFCTNLADCFNYYSFDPENKVAEVVAYGDVYFDNNKACTNKLRIIRAITWEEVLRLVNTGKGNSGNCNSGSYNSGNWNSGDWNSGSWNSGSYNSGDYNSGSYNSGDWNSADRNSGSHNSGSYNSGDYNSGDYNSGDCNSGSYNSGDWNSGNCNSGSYNSGNWNSGNYNSGSYNSGSYNSGDWNSGNCNKTNFSSGCFNTEEQKILMFNKPSEWTYRDWNISKARQLMDRIQPYVVEWIWACDMTNKEKEAHPNYTTTGGYLKEISNEDAYINWWQSLTNDEKEVIKAIPNFDSEIFKEITGIDVEEV